MELNAYLTSLYISLSLMHEVVVTIVENIERPCNTCIYLEDVNKGTKNMANGKVADVTLITREL